MKKLILSILLLAPVLLSAQVVIGIQLKSKYVKYVNAAVKQWNEVNPVTFEFKDYVEGKRTFGIMTDQNFNDSGYIDLWYSKNDSVIISKRFTIYVIDPTFYESLFHIGDYVTLDQIMHYGRKNYTPRDYYYDLAKIKQRKTYYSKHPNAPIEYIFLIEQLEL